MKTKIYLLAMLTALAVFGTAAAQFSAADQPMRVACGDDGGDGDGGDGGSDSMDPEFVS